MPTPDAPARRLIGVSLIRAVYLGLFSLVGVLLGVRPGRTAGEHPMMIAVDETLRGGGDPEMTADFTGVGAFGPTVVGLGITIPVLLLYPLYEVPAVLTAILAYMMTCTALAATQTARHMAALRDRNRWRAAGRPPAWKSSALARPSNIDIVVWIVLAALLVWATR